MWSNYFAADLATSKTYIHTYICMCECLKREDSCSFRDAYLHITYIHTHAWVNIYLPSIMMQCRIIDDVTRKPITLCSMRKFLFLLNLSNLNLLIVFTLWIITAKLRQQMFIRKMFLGLSRCFWMFNIKCCVCVCMVGVWVGVYVPPPPSVMPTTERCQ